MVSETEGECLEYALSKGALIRQIPDPHGTEHIGKVTEDYLCTKNVAQKSRYERQSRRAMSHWIWSDRVAHLTRRNKMYARLSANIEPEVVVGQSCHLCQ